MGKLGSIENDKVTDTVTQHLKKLSNNELPQAFEANQAALILSKASFGKTIDDSML